MGLLNSNLLPRLHLLKIALLQRFIWRDVVEMARGYGMDYVDVRGNDEPIGFALDLLGVDGAPDDISRLIATPESFLPAGAPSVFNSEPSVARFLGQLVYYKRCKVVIELGCFVGWATAHMARSLAAHGGGRLFALDLSREYLDATVTNLRRHNLADYVTTVQGGSLDPRALGELPDRADVIFLDTSHAYPATLHELREYLPRLTPGGCFVLHDSTNAPGVRRSLAELGPGYRVMTFATEHSNGITVLRRS